MTGSLFRITRDDFRKFEKHKEQWELILKESKKKVANFSQKMLQMGAVKQQIEQKMGPPELLPAANPENKCSRYIAGTDLLQQKHRLDAADEKAREAVRSD